MIRRHPNSGDAHKFHILGGTPFLITPYRYQLNNSDFIARSVFDDRVELLPLDRVTPNQHVKRVSNL